MESTIERAEQLHDASGRDVTPFMKQALEDVVDGVLDTGTWPRSRKGKLVRAKFWLVDFLDGTDDCHELLAKLVGLRGDDLLLAADDVERDIRERLTKCLADSELVQERARELEEQDREDGDE